MVTSVIHVSDTPLSCKNFRSRYTPQERLDQTVSTCKSVRDRLPRCCIVVLEGSETSEYEISVLRRACDIVYMVSRETRLRVNSPIKAYGEVSILLDFLSSQAFTTLCRDNNFRTISKISGRYTLTDKFDFHRYPLTKLVVHAEHGHRGWMNTRYYRVPMAIIQSYTDDLRSVQALSEKREVALEEVQFKTIPPEAFHFVCHGKGEYIGVQGTIAIRQWIENVEDFRP